MQHRVGSEQEQRTIHSVSSSTKDYIVSITWKTHFHTFLFAMFTMKCLELNLEIKDLKKQMALGFKYIHILESHHRCYYS